jgi:hypothetical protein
MPALASNQRRFRIRGGGGGENHLFFRPIVLCLLICLVLKLSFTKAWKKTAPFPPPNKIYNKKPVFAKNLLNYLVKNLYTVDVV